MCLYETELKKNQGKINLRKNVCKNTTEFTYEHFLKSQCKRGTIE